MSPKFCEPFSAHITAALCLHSEAFSPLIKCSPGQSLCDTLASCSYLISSFSFLSHNLSLGGEIRTATDVPEPFSFPSRDVLCFPRELGRRAAGIRKPERLLAHTHSLGQMTEAGLRFPPQIVLYNSFHFRFQVLETQAVHLNMGPDSRGCFVLHRLPGEARI